MVVNHEEALLLAQMKQQESNLARCYLEAISALEKIHDLAGELARSVDHPHVGAIQAWVHQVSPCQKA
jgi:hypothetical protein